MIYDKKNLKQPRYTFIDEFVKLSCNKWEIYSEDRNCNETIINNHKERLKYFVFQEELKYFYNTGCIKSERNRKAFLVGETLKETAYMRYFRNCITRGILCSIKYTGNQPRV